MVAFAVAVLGKGIRSAHCISVCNFPSVSGCFPYAWITSKSEQSSAPRRDAKIPRKSFGSFRDPRSLRRSAGLSEQNLGGHGGGSGGWRGGSGPPDGEGTPSDGFASRSRMLGAIVIARRRKQNLREWSQRRAEPVTNLGQLLRSIRISHILLGLNVIVFALQNIYGPSVLAAGAKVNRAIAGGEYYRLLSPMFLHGSVTHLMVNSFSLHSTGPSVESWFGKSRFLTLYIASGIAGNILSYLCTPTPSVGASGAIFGLVGASAVILARHHKILGPRARRGLNSLAYIVLVNFGMGMTPGSRIDNFGHLGGFLGGIAYAYLAGPRLVLKPGLSGRSVLLDEPVLSIAVKEFKGKLRPLRAFFENLLPRR